MHREVNLVCKWIVLRTGSVSAHLWQRAVSLQG